MHQLPYCQSRPLPGLISYCVWAWYRALTPVKQTLLCGSNLLECSTDKLMWVCPKILIKKNQLLTTLRFYSKCCFKYPYYSYYYYILIFLLIMNEWIIEQPWDFFITVKKKIIIKWKNDNTSSVKTIIVSESWGAVEPLLLFVFSRYCRRKSMDGQCFGRTCQEELVSGLDPTRSVASQPSFVCKAMQICCW